MWWDDVTYLDDSSDVVGPQTVNFLLSMPVITVNVAII